MMMRRMNLICYPAVAWECNQMQQCGLLPMRCYIWPHYAFGCPHESSPLRTPMDQYMSRIVCTLVHATSLQEGTVHSMFWIGRTMGSTLRCGCVLFGIESAG